jgi:hypothetical protein
MTQKKTWLFGLAVGLAACSGGEPSPDTSDSPQDVSSSSGSGGGQAAGAASVTGRGGTGAGGVGAGAGGAPVVAGGAGGAAGAANGGARPGGSGGVAPSEGGSAGAAPTGGMSGAAGGGGATPSGPLEPIIPEVNGACPTFTSGTKTVSGLGGIQFTAGAKGDGKGALVFYWHGTGSFAGESANIPAAARSEITGEGGVIVSFGRSKGGDDCSGTGTFSVQDFEVVDQIVACAVKEHGIDPHRIFTTGCSAGGLQAGCMAIRRSNYVAATAPNSGGVTIGYGKMQDPTRVAAVMTMHGSAADKVIVSFPGTSKAYDNYMIRAGSPMVINCDHGGGHCGAPSALQASAWQFMKAHPFGIKPSPYANGLPEGFHRSCKIAEPSETLPIGETGPDGKNGL